MKFAHLADCHIGGWREPRLRELGLKAFSRAIDICIEKKVDFAVIAGDLFNTSLPALDSLKEAVLKLRELKDNGIQVYIVAGSHDYSPSGKTILDVLENAGLVVNLVKGSVYEGKLKLQFTKDEKTGAMIAGMLGKKGSLEKQFYGELDRFDDAEGFKVFVFHSAVTELNPVSEAGSLPLSLLPEGFDYYAGGHPHIVLKANEKGGTIAYPGPVFPNNFEELERLKNGGFYIVENKDELDVQWQPVMVAGVFPIKIDCGNKTPEKVEEEIYEMIKNYEFTDNIVTLRLFGCLKSGKCSDIDFKTVIDRIYSKGAYFVMKNTYNLSSTEFEEIKVKQLSIEDIESSLIDEHAGQIDAGMPRESEIILTKKMIQELDNEKLEDERAAAFEARIRENCIRILGLD